MPKGVPNKREPHHEVPVCTWCGSKHIDQEDCAVYWKGKYEDTSRALVQCTRMLADAMKMIDKLQPWRESSRNGHGGDPT